VIVRDAAGSVVIATTLTEVVPLATETSLPGIRADTPLTVNSERVDIALDPRVSRKRTGSRISPFTTPSSSPVPPSLMVIVTVRLSIVESEVTSTKTPSIRLKILFGVDPTGKSIVNDTELPTVTPSTLYVKEPAKSTAPAGI
jgi:hypothetical protein